jgi:hypothetical protein
VITGTSRWQCGHQWAMNATSLGCPSFTMATGPPSNACPRSSGAALPTAGSAPLSGSGASGVPLIDTGRVCAVPAGVLVPPPVTADTTIATTAASTTTPQRTSRSLFRDDDVPPDGTAPARRLPDFDGRGGTPGRV